MNTEKVELLRRELEQERGTMRRQELLKQLLKLERQLRANSNAPATWCDGNTSNRTKTNR
jgi:hypothetical protein